MINFDHNKHLISIININCIHYIQDYYGAKADFNHRNRRHTKNQSHPLHQHFKSLTCSSRPVRFWVFRWVLNYGRVTLDLLFVDDFGDEEMVVLLLEVIQCFIGTGLLLELLYLHLMVVKFITLWITIFENFLKNNLLMHGGLKSNANLYGRNPLGGADFLLLPPYFFGAGFYF